MASLSLKALNRRRLIGRFVKKRLSKLSFLLYFVALVWLLVIPDDRHSHRTYFSENALLPGQTTRYFSASDARRVTRLSEELSRLENSGSEERARFVKEELHSCGLKSDTQKFETRSPASKKNISGVNAYGIVTAPRADGTEAMVLSATWTSRDGVHPNYDGVAAVITLGCFFRQYSFWSKDIVVLVADRQETGAQAWIETYHGSQSNAFQMVEPLQLRSGAIQAAINLDFKGAGRYKSLGIFLEGVNGHLPNLDLVNTVDWISRTEGTQISLHDNQAYSPFLGYGEAVDQYVTSLTAVTRMMLHQASGYPTGTHGVFHRYKIDALTIYGIPADDAQQYAVGFDRIGRIIESTFRSINHLIEHLHQSFFLYLLSSLQRYISIGLYIPPVILMIVSFILKSVSLWWNTAHTCPHPKTKTDPSADENDIQSATGKEGEITPEGYIVAAPAYSLTDARVLASPTVTILLAYACGLAIFMISKSDFGARSGGPKMAFYFTLGLATWVHVVAVLVVIPQARKWIHDYLFGTTANHVSSPCQDSCTAEWQTLKAASLGIVAMTVSGIAPLNYSLSVLISVMVGIPYLCVTRTRNIFLWMAQGLVISGLSPPVLGMIAAKLTGTDGAGMAEVWGRLTDGYDIMGIWILPFICLIYWPSNIMFSSLLYQQS